VYWQTSLFLSLFLTVLQFLPRVHYTSFSTLGETCTRAMRLESRECRRVRSACGRYTRIKSIVDGSSWPLHWISIGLAEFSRPFLFAKETRRSGADCKLCRAREERAFRLRRRRRTKIPTHVPLISIQLDRNTLREPRSMFRNAAFAAAWHFDSCEPPLMGRADSRTRAIHI